MFCVTDKNTTFGIKSHEMIKHTPSQDDLDQLGRQLAQQLNGMDSATPNNQQSASEISPSHAMGLSAHELEAVW